MNADRFVVSIKPLYLALIVLSLSIGYLAYQHYLRVAVVTESELLQFVLAAHDLSANISSLPEFREADLVRLNVFADSDQSHSALQAFVGIRIKKRPPAEALLLLKKATESLLLGSRVVTGAQLAQLPPTRIHPRTNCVVGVFRGRSSKAIGVATMGTAYGSYDTSLSDIYLVKIGDQCGSPIPSVLLIDVSKYNRGWLIGVPATRLSDIVDQKPLPILNDIILYVQQLLGVDATPVLADYFAFAIFRKLRETSHTLGTTPIFAIK
jgi:hypothetical protein